MAMETTKLPEATIIHQEERRPYLNSAIGIDLQKFANYLQNCEQNSCIVRIWHPKIVPRSYGKEKRLFAPPPIIVLLGNGWIMNKVAVRSHLTSYRIKLREAYIASSAEEKVRIEKLLNQLPDLPLRLNLNVGMNTDESPFISTIESEATIKNLFFSSTDRRRYFKLSFELAEYLGPTTLYSARSIGKFESSEIRVVSKPPKKQSIRGADSAHINLKSGMQVALFSRARSQGVATRYLYALEPGFVASLERWSSFYIYAVDTNETEDFDKSFVIRQGFIFYNQVIRLVDVLTGISSPNLILRKVDKNVIQVASQQMTEPVAMLQRVAFQFCDTPNAYLALAGNAIIQKDARVIDHLFHEADDSTAWSITNSELIEYRFFEVMGPTKEPVTPIPFIKSAQLEGVKEHTAVIEFSGANLGKNLVVFFGLVSTNTISANASNIRCRVPSVQEVTKFSEMGIPKIKKDESYKVPISLVRGDGVVYLTNIEFQYSGYSAGEIGRIVYKVPLKFDDDEDDKIDLPLDPILTENEEEDDDQE